MAGEYICWKAVDTHGAYINNMFNHIIHTDNHLICVIFTEVQRQRWNSRQGAVEHKWYFSSNTE